MQLSHDFMEELHDRVDIVDVIGSHVELKKRGRLYVGLCPFHNEKTGSFTVYADTKNFYCFGCHAGGDVVEFVKRYENLDFVEAVKTLADSVGMQMPDEADRSEIDRKKRILEMNRLAARYFFDCLNSDEGKAARSYLRKRGLQDATIIHFGLGYAPSGWDGLRNYLRSKGYRYEEMIEAGLCNEGKSGGCYDFFRERVMFPVIDVRGQVVAFSGRTMGTDSRKYLNTRDTPVFKKSRTLFGMNFAKNADTGRVILVEGQMDVIALHQAGFTDAVATLGTAITDEHARILSRYVSEVLISYDADNAGQNATKRAINTLRAADIPIRVIQIEGGKDPDELIKAEGPSAYQALIDRSSGSMAYELDRARKKFDLESAEGKVDYLKEAAVILAGVSSRTEREVWAGRVAEQTGVEKSTIMDSVDRLFRSRAAADRRKREAGIANSVGERYNLKPYERAGIGSAAAERRLIALLCAHPDLCPKVRERVGGSDFVSAETGAIFDAICGLMERGEFAGFASASTVLTSDQMALFSGILAENSEIKYSVSDCDFYVDRILAKSQRPSAETIKTMDPAEIRKLMQSRNNESGDKK